MSDPVIRLNVALKGRYRIDRELGLSVHTYVRLVFRSVFLCSALFG